MHPKQDAAPSGSTRPGRRAAGVTPKAKTTPATATASTPALTLRSTPTPDSATTPASSRPASPVPRNEVLFILSDTLRPDYEHAHEMSDSGWDSAGVEPEMDEAGEAHWLATLKAIRDEKETRQIQFLLPRYLLSVSSQLASP